MRGVATTPPRCLAEAESRLVDGGEKHHAEESVCSVDARGDASHVAPACASKKFVRTEVGGVNQKVDTLSTDGRANAGAHARRTKTRIGEVDKKAEAAGQSAATANKAAADAQHGGCRRAGTRQRRWHRSGQQGEDR